MEERTGNPYALRVNPGAGCLIESVESQFFSKKKEEECPCYMLKSSTIKNSNKEYSFFLRKCGIFNFSIEKEKIIFTKDDYKKLKQAFYEDYEENAHYFTFSFLSQLLDDVSWP
jgi:hypothetical protein